VNMYINLLDDVHVGALSMEIVRGSFKWNKPLRRKMKIILARLGFWR
jgi:hypothetical protein